MTHREHIAARIARALPLAGHRVLPTARRMLQGIFVATAIAPLGGGSATLAILVGAADSLPPVTINDNRKPAGRLDAGVLTLRLEARNGIWRPEGPDGLGLPIAAFAEAGKPLQNPGPLIRVPAGTEVRITLRNSLAKPLTIIGLGEQRGSPTDTVRLEPGAVREVHFRASTPGTYYYAGKTGRAPVLGRSTEDSQLQGAIVVDPAMTRTPPHDRVFLIGWWFTLDEANPTGLGKATLVINGLSWPHTERLDAAQGDSLRWRWINLTGLDHPIHLHGFYFRVDGVGDGSRYTEYAPDERRTGVTEVVHPGATMALTWSPNRPGNWIVHCHLASHISHLVSLGGPPAPTGGRDHHAAAPSHQMAGLVLGISVRPRGHRPKLASDPRTMRLLVRSRPYVFGDQPGYAYVLGGSREEADTSALPTVGPTLVLEKDQPVAITIVNRSHEPAAVHWHGIELESFPDGVPGWSGNATATLPAIAPGDSLTVRFTPPRAGTFMYHSHFNEMQQIASGLYGAIVVVEPGQQYNPDTDRVLLFSDDGPTANIIRGPYPAALLNGKERPEPLELRAGVTYRLRFINIRTDYTMSVGLFDGASRLQWTPRAKDGADLPAAKATPVPAELTFSPGEIHDVMFTPRAAGELALQYIMGAGGPGSAEPLPTRIPVRVR